MTLQLFPDNTVLCNFAAVSRLRLLQEVLRDRGRWVEAVAAEAQRSASHYPDLAKIPTEGWLGDPITIEDPDEIDQLERVRRAAFGGLASEPLQHLGEAQTCHVIETRAEFARSFWLTDDRDAFDYARARGITTRDTMDLVAEAVSDGCCSRADGFQMLYQMSAAGRHLRLPERPADL